MIACAAMPVAGNVYMVATHYNLPSERISIAILISLPRAFLQFP